MVLLELRGRVRDVMPGDALRRRLEIVEAALGDARDELRADARLAGRFVGDDDASGLANGCRHRAVVDG